MAIDTSGAISERRRQKYAALARRRSCGKKECFGAIGPDNIKLGTSDNVQGCGRKGGRVGRSRFGLWMKQGGAEIMNRRRRHGGMELCVELFSTCRTRSNFKNYMSNKIEQNRTKSKINSTCRIRHPTRRIRHSTRRIRHATRRIRHATCRIKSKSKFDMYTFFQF